LTTESKEAIVSLARKIFALRPLQNLPYIRGKTSHHQTPIPLKDWANHIKHPQKIEKPK